MLILVCLVKYKHFKRYFWNFPTLTLMNRFFFLYPSVRSISFNYPISKTNCITHKHHVFNLRHSKIISDLLERQTERQTEYINTFHISWMETFLALCIPFL